jgi:hypothetical protein
MLKIRPKQIKSLKILSIDPMKFSSQKFHIGEIKAKSLGWKEKLGYKKRYYVRQKY